MSNLRLFGLLLSLFILVIIARYYRTRGGKSPFLLGISTALALGLVSYTPDTFNAFFNLLTSTKNQYYRIIILLIVSICFLLILQLRNLFITESHEQALRELVFKHSSREFDDHYNSDNISSIQIVIPAYNEAQNLDKLLSELPSSLKGKPTNALIVSDGSQDNTGRVAKKHGYPVIENLTNVGGGISLKVGFNIVRRHDADVIVTMDADGQHDPADLSRLIEPILSGEADFVVGSRQLGETQQTSLVRRTGVVFFNKLITLLLNRSITDCSSGYRAFKTDLLEKLDLREPRYHTTEFLIQALSKGVEYREVPVTIRERMQGKSKKGPDLLYGFQFFRVLLRTWWGA